MIFNLDNSLALSEKILGGWGGWDSRFGRIYF